MTDLGKISSVADTALWVATFRGNEGARADAAFHDPLAAMLAAARGRKIAASMPRSAVVAWAMVVRTSAIDTLLTDGSSVRADHH